MNMSKISYVGLFWLLYSFLSDSYDELHTRPGEYLSERARRLEENRQCSWVIKTSLFLSVLLPLAQMCIRFAISPAMRFVQRLLIE